MAQQLRFSSEAPSKQLLTDFANVNQLTDEQLEQFANIALAYLTQDSGAATLLHEFATKHGVKEKPLRNTVRGVLYFFSEALKKNMAPAQVKEDLLGLGLAEPKAAMLSAKWQKSFVSLSESQVSRTLRFNQLVDMEWKFGVTASTDELEKVGACFLQLKLVLDRGGTRENVLMELTLPQFYQFLKEMNAASRQMATAASAVS